MHLLFPVAVAVVVAASAQPAVAPSSPMEPPTRIEGSDCPEADRYFAQRGGRWHGKPLRPHKLTELPPADTYAAMLRTDERGCMVPIKYRDTRR